MSDVALSTRPEGVLSRRYLLATLGMCALIGIAAFESLAVTTIMPIVSADLDGESLYSLSFAAPLATGLVGMVVAGNWADRSGPRVVVIASMLLFAVGLLVVGAAPDMTVFLFGRLVQGLGSGAVIVGLYVMVARLYPPALHPSIFAGFAAAWVVPALVGPLIAGLVAESLSWHWVFVGAVVLAVPAFVMILPSLRRVPPPDRADGGGAVPWSPRRILWAAGAALGVLALNLVDEFEPAVAVAVVVAAVAALAIALRPLLPPGTLRARAGLPTLVLLRGLVGAAFLASEVYIPYLLQDRYGFSSSASGTALTAGALGWALASWSQGRLGERVPQRTGIRIGIVLVLGGLVVATLTPLLGLAPGALIATWTLAGFGMGFMYPRFSVLTLALSTGSDRGFNSSALTISDSAGSAVALAVAGGAFGLLGGASSPYAFAACFAIGSTVALLALVLSGRAVPRRT
ncbi:MFS transporter [Frigoribacterium sp. CFBP 13712]|uniref:MFS transporter n=1 Tax=Frigoribacterium sp. CFBP 13712 TaxID=2775309 RepID=UPI00177BFBAC|nr:MFS transporter [Frigoribacterium sp. CFBP 13712]MBD8702586.1 MFS transporter [Frigoribacterium sp. CFBP 13712]